MGGDDDECEALPVVTDGKCGPSDGQTLTTKPTTGLCTGGNDTEVIGTGPWSWDCLGLMGGDDDECEADKFVDECGPSDEQTFETKPTTGLCISGDTPDVEGDGPWSWNCSAEGEECTAYPTPVGSPICSSSFDEDSINSGGESTWSWSSSNTEAAAYVCTNYSCNNGFCEYSGVGMNGILTAEEVSLGSRTEIYDSKGTDYNRSCMIVFVGPGGSIPCTANLTITDGSSPVVDIKVKKPEESVYLDGSINIEYGTRVNLWWESEDTDNCIASDGSSDWPGVRALDGTHTTDELINSSYTYKITCDKNGKTSSDSVIVNVIDAPEYSCTGTIPTGSTAYDEEESIGLIVDTNWTFSASDTTTKCQYYTPVSLPTCTAYFSPISITAPGSSNLTWVSSPNAVDIKYSCTGPKPGGVGYGLIPLQDSVDFYFNESETGTESCIFTVKDNLGDENSCTTGNVIISPPIPSPINGACGTADGYTFAVSDIGYFPKTQCAGDGIPSSTNFPDLGTSQGWICPGVNGGNPSSPCIAYREANPPEIIGRSFKVRDQKTGLKPVAQWSTNNVVRCDMASDTDYSKTNVCASVGACSVMTSFLIDKTIMEETTYTLTCYNIAGDVDTAVFTPPIKFEIIAEPTEVEVDFVGGGATTEPGIDVGVISWNGYQNSVSFTADLSGLPESPGDATTNRADFSHIALSFADYFTNGKSFLQIFASHRFTGEKVITIWGNETESVNITITSEQTIPIWDPI